MSDDVQADDFGTDESHETKGTFLITGLIMLMVVAVWILVYASLLNS